MGDASRTCTIDGLLVLPLLGMPTTIKDGCPPVVQGTDRDDEHLNIFLEFVPGGSIASLLNKFGMPRKHSSLHPFVKACVIILTKHKMSSERVCSGKTIPPHTATLCAA